jgi:hypothetical protein
VVLETGFNESVFLGAANAIRWAIERFGLISKESRKLEAPMASTDGTIWDAVRSVTLMQWNQEGDRMQEVPVVVAPVKWLLVLGVVCR